MRRKEPFRWAGPKRILAVACSFGRIAAGYRLNWPALAGLFAGQNRLAAAAGLAAIPLGMSSKLPPIVVARRPKPRDQAPRPEEAQPLRIVFAGKKYGVYRKPAP